MSYGLLSPEDGQADSDIQYGVMGKKISGGQKQLTECHYLVSSLERITVRLSRSLFYSLFLFRPDRPQACIAPEVLVRKYACLFTVMLI